MAQQIMKSHREIQPFLTQRGITSLLIVCEKSARQYLSFADALDEVCDTVTWFGDFSPNPDENSALEGAHVLSLAKAKAVLAIGGGSAIDVGKAIKHYAEDEALPLLAMPTTAGTGSEATCFAVVYRNGEKVSLESPSLLPDVAILDPSTLETLPRGQRAATLMDTLCHAIESYWSVGSSPASQQIARKALDCAFAHAKGYIDNIPEDNAQMLLAANLSGQAINLTRTTAAHAMSYKITSLFGIPHGYAVSLCLAPVYRFMLDHLEEKCFDPRGAGYVGDVLQALETDVQQMDEMRQSLGLKSPSLAGGEQLHLLVDSVNPQRLANNPVSLNRDDLLALYRQIFDHQQQ